MNIENIKKAIAIMERAKERGSLCMLTWRAVDPSLTALQRANYTCARTEEQFHACGNTACFAGHLAIAPEWIKDGGGCEYNGMPKFTVTKGDFVDYVLYAEHSVAHWLGIDVLIASNLIHHKGIHDNHPVYKTNWGRVKADHVIAALNELAELGNDGFIAKYNLVAEQYDPELD